MAELLIGCGNHRNKVLHEPGKEGWVALTTLDLDPNCGADVEWDLERMPLPFPDEKFDEIHAYHVLEHTGRQGDYRFFFAQFSEFWRLLTPGGLLCLILPTLDGPWAFGDPGHTRVLPPQIFTFLNQDEYEKQVGITALADYRHVYRADFEQVFEHRIDADQHAFILKAGKPSRCSR